MTGCPYLQKNGTQCGGSLDKNCVLCKKHQQKQSGGGILQIPTFGIADSIASLFKFNALEENGRKKSKR